MVQPGTADGEAHPSNTLSTLHEVGERVSARLALEELLADTLRRVVDLLQADAGAIFVSHERERELVLASHQGLSPGFAAKEARLPFGTCTCGHAIEAEEALFLIEDVAQEPRCVIGSCFEDGFRSLLCLPLQANDKVWGLLRLHGREPGAFDRRQARFLAFIGSQLGLAIQRTRLQEEVGQLLLRVEEERATLDSLVRSLIDGLILVDGQGRIAYLNPSAEQYLGVGASTMLGEALPAAGARLLAAMQEPAQTAERFQQAMADLASYPQVEFQGPAPSPRILQARFFPAQGGKGYGIVLRDVTSERQLDEIKSQLLSTVSHELRTPLASIKGFATTLLRDDVQWDPATQREFLQIIDQEADRLGELIGNLLESSRIGAGALRIDCGPVALAELIAEAVAEMRPRAAGHAFTLDVPAHLPEISADARRIRQVLHNLLENAVKYSPGGEICVGVRVDGREVLVSVSDQGMGIAPDHLERVFQRFYQVDGAATRRAGGAGLGLWICQGIIQAHGGRIWAESTLGVGSTFHFSLPSERRCPEREGDLGS